MDDVNTWNEAKDTSEKMAINKVRKHICEMGLSGKLTRARALEEQILFLEQELKERRERFATQAPGSPEHVLNKKMILARIEERKKLIRELDHCLAIINTPVNVKDGVTQTEIDRARTYPISEVIEVKKGFARCVGGTHNDSTPSMDTRNGFVYCYACGFSGDVIDVAMKVWGMGFGETVRRLQ